METHALNRLIAEWLARAHPVPQQAQIEWSSNGVALLPLGDRFAAIRISGGLMHTALGCDEPLQVAKDLAKRLQGPVIHDHRIAGSTYYPLVNWGAGVLGQLEQDPDAPCLGVGTYLGVPRIDRLEPPGTYWIVPPRYDGDLCPPRAVRELVAAGRRRLTQDSSV